MHCTFCHFALYILPLCTVHSATLHCTFCHFLKVKKVAQTRIGTRNFRHPKKCLDILDIVDILALGDFLTP